MFFYLHGRHILFEKYSSSKVAWMCPDLAHLLVAHLLCTCAGDLWTGLYPSIELRRQRHPWTIRQLCNWRLYVGLSVSVVPSTYSLPAHVISRAEQKKQSRENRAEKTERPRSGIWAELMGCKMCVILGLDVNSVSPFLVDGCRCRIWAGFGLEITVFKRIDTK